MVWPVLFCLRPDQRLADRGVAAQALEAFLDLDGNATVCDHTLAQRQRRFQLRQNLRSQPGGYQNLSQGDREPPLPPLAVACPPLGRAAAEAFSAELAAAARAASKAIRAGKTPPRSLEGGGFVDVGAGCGVRELRPGSDQMAVASRRWVAFASCSAKNSATEFPP